MLKRNADYVFTDNDLHNEDVMNREIDLLHHKKQGQQQVTEVLWVHVRYDAFSDGLKSGAKTERDLQLKKASQVRLVQKKIPIYQGFYPAARPSPKLCAEYIASAKSSAL